MLLFSLFSRLLTHSLSDGGQSGRQVAEPDWSYEGDTGPEKWGSLSEDYAACDSGVQQSPIDITGYSQQDGSSLVFRYSEAWPMSATNNHRSASFSYDYESSVAVDGLLYFLDSVHLHAPSEHLIDGESFAAELHLVHATNQENLAVVGSSVPARRGE